MEFFPIEPIRPGLPDSVQRIVRDHQRERTSDDEGSPSEDPDERAFEEDFSEAYELSRSGEPPTASPEDHQTPGPPMRDPDWDPRLRRERRTSRDHDEDDAGEDEPGAHIDIIA